MEISKECTPTGELYHGHTVVGTTPVQLCEGFKTTRGVLLRCPGSADEFPGSNVKPVWVGKDKVSKSNGMPIIPGSSLFIPIDDPSKLFVVSTAAGQDIAWMGI